MPSTLSKISGLILFMAASIAAFGQCTVPPCSNIDKQVMGSRWPAFGVDSGTANAYAVTTTAALGPSLRTGSKIMFFATHANTTASTLAVNGGSAIAIKKNVSIALASGDILLNGLVEVVYDGTNFQMVGNGVFSGSVSCSQLPAFTGDTTTSAGSCATTTVKVNGVSYPASPSTHAVPVITASNTATYKVVPDCQDTGGNHLNFTQSGDSITCGTSGGGGGGGGAGTCSSVGQIGTPVASSGFSGTSITMSFSCTSSVVVIGVTSTTAATNPLTVTGTGAACPASWTLAKSSVSHANVGWLYYGKTAGSGSCVISTNVSCSGWCFEVGAEFANMNPVVDKALADYSSGTSSITTSLPALSNTNDIIVSLLGGFHTGWTASPTAPLTSLVASNASNLAWYQSSSASAQSFTWGITCCGSLWWDDNVILNAAFTSSTSSALFNQAVQVDGTNFAQEPITDYVSGTGTTCSGTDDSANTRTKVQCDLSNQVTAGSCGDTTHSCGLNYNAQGQITGVTNNAIAGAGASGALILLCSVTASAASVEKFDSSNNCFGANPFTSSYDTYEVVVNAFTVGTNDAFAKLQFSTNSGSTYDTAGVYYWDNLNQQIGTGTTGTNGLTSQTAIALFADSAGHGLLSTATPAMSIDFKIEDPLSSSNYKHLFGRGIAQYSQNSNNYGFNFDGYYLNTNAVNSFKIFPSAGTFSGNIRVYGLSH